MRIINGKPIRETRGSNHFRPSRKPDNSADTRYPSGHPAKATPYGPSASVTASCAEAGIYNDNCECQETAEDYIIPRKSLTVKQHLALFPQEVEYESRTIRRWQLDKRSLPLPGTIGPVRMIETTDESRRIAWKSDRSLLNHNNPFLPPKPGRRGIKRLTSQSKRIVYDQPDGPAVVEIPTDD
jgi:hypothetical protein